MRMLCKICVVLLVSFLQAYVNGLVKVDAADNVVGGDREYHLLNGTRETVIDDIAEAVVDAADLYAVLEGISRSLENKESWLQLVRSGGIREDTLGEHLLKGHGPSGGISQTHIVTASEFLGDGAVDGIVAPSRGIGLAISPKMPTITGIFGGSGQPINYQWDSWQKEVSRVNLPVHKTVSSIIAKLKTGRRVFFQVAPIAKMRKFIVKLDQPVLVDVPRPIIYDDKTVHSREFSEAWIKKQNDRSWKVAQRPLCLVVSLPQRSDAQVSAITEILLKRQLTIPVLVEEAAALQCELLTSIPAGGSYDKHGRETQRIPMTIYYGYN